MILMAYLYTMRRTYVALLLATIHTFAVAIASPRSADVIIKMVQKQAEAEGKNVFIIFSRTGCVWCNVLENFIESNEIKPIFGKYFISTRLMLGSDANTNPGSDSYVKKYGVRGGVPFHLFIEANGKLIINSIIKETGLNIGYPVAEAEIEWFMHMVRNAALKMTDQEALRIQLALRNFKKGPPH
jgi:hypothetical protein